MRAKTLAGKSMGAILFGYARLSGIIIVEEDAILVRHASKLRLIKSQSYEMISLFFIKMRVPMNAKRLRKMLLHPGYAGKIFYEGKWIKTQHEPILTWKDHLALKKKDRETNGI